MKNDKMHELFKNDIQLSKKDYVHIFHMNDIKEALGEKECAVKVLAH